MDHHGHWITMVKEARVALQSAKTSGKLDELTAAIAKAEAANLDPREYKEAKTEQDIVVTFLR